MWQSGEVIVWRNVYRNTVWSALPLIVVKDSPQELVLALLPGAECQVEETYHKGKKAANRRWEFQSQAWNLAPFIWHTNRLLILLEPEKFYAVMLFWQNDTDEFEDYYINFQLPFQRSHCGIDTLDLELDLDVYPDQTLVWKDQDEYQKAIAGCAIHPEWAQAIEQETPVILGKVEQRAYPFDGSWLDWRPDPNWAQPRLPENWDKI